MSIRKAERLAGIAIRSAALVAAVTLAACSDETATSPDPASPETVLASATTSLGDEVIATAILKTFHASGNGRTREILSDSGGTVKVNVNHTNGTTRIVAPTVTVDAIAGTHFTSGGEGFGIQNPDDDSAERKSMEGDEGLGFELTDSVGARIGEFFGTMRHYGTAADVEVVASLHGSTIVVDTVSFPSGVSKTNWSMALTTPVTALRFQALSGRLSIGNAKFHVVAPDDLAPAFGLFETTTETYPHSTNMTQVCQQAYGAEYRNTDWADVQAALAGGMPIEDIAPAALNHAWMTYNGAAYWSGSRRYFASRFTHPGYLVHYRLDASGGTSGSTVLYMGSWPGTYHVSCYRDSGS